MDPLLRFEFSQTSLQDYADCRRRFQLRYLQRVAWPAIQAEPVRENERHIQRGERFHRLAQQYLVGMPEARLTRMAEADEDENLQRWWQNFLDCIPAQLSGDTDMWRSTLARAAGQLPPGGASMTWCCSGRTGRVRIYDWKTATAPAKARLAAASGCKRGSTPTCWPRPARCSTRASPSRRNRLR